MTYDADGLRSTKQINGVKTEYQYVGDKLFYENRGNGDSFYYFYDSYGKLSAIYHHRNGTKVAYHVVTNAQGDVVSLYNYEGGFVASYEYDAWGNCTIVSDNSSTGIATLNPMRYRGYYYDKDLGLYYLQSRYYDAEIGRFINADGTLNGNGDITGFNMFAYCSNNPVMFSDPSGCGLFDKIRSSFSKFLNDIYVAFNTKILKKQPLPYQSVTDAAIASGENLNTLTQGDDSEHGQGIIYDKYTDTYGLTDVIDGQHSSVDFGSLLFPRRSDLVAIVHSHPCCNGHNGNEFSNVIENPDGTVSGDWVVSSTHKINVYLAAPNGTLYLMAWDVGEYNQSEIYTYLPNDDSPIVCG